MKIRVAVLAAVMVLAGCNNVFIDYDAGYDFDTIETFAWAPTEGTSLKDSNPLLHSRVVNAIEHYLTLGGIREVESNPDVYVTYHTSTKENLQLNTTSYGYGYPAGWGWGGYYGRYGYGGFHGSTTTATTYLTGTLIVDVWDAETKELVWRGTAADMTVYEKPEKMAKRIETALTKLVNQGQKMKAE
jgi:hypothetical protein